MVTPHGSGVMTIWEAVTISEATQLAVERFLYHEAALIDQRRWDEWLDLFTEDARYWLPADEENPEDEAQAAIINEDRDGIAKRIKRLEHPSTLTELPPRRTRHFITNVRAFPLSEAELLVTSNQLVYAVRLGAQAQYPGSWEHTLGRVGEQLKISRKNV